jgi:hypothetical protein
MVQEVGGSRAVAQVSGIAAIRCGARWPMVVLSKGKY